MVVLLWCYCVDCVADGDVGGATLLIVLLLTVLVVLLR
jgi:hypothetical protein